MFINGQWLLSSSGAVVEDVNPATGQSFAKVAQASSVDVEAAISAAEAAKTAWGAMLAGEREAILLRAADVFAAHREELRDLIIRENGSVWIKAPWEVDYAVDCLRSAASFVRQPSGETFPTSTPGVVSMTIRQPLGVIGGISPFNSPLLLSMKKIAFALAAGNTFVLKPSELTPLVGLKIAELFDKAGLPPGVLNVVPGDATVGKALVQDARVRMITFTGSSKAGRQLAADCGANLKRVCLELGGKSPIVVLKDADLDYAVDAAAFGIFFHQGQVCMANSRIIVERPLFDAFCEKFIEKARGIKVGEPTAPDTVVGPLIRESQCGFIMEQLNDATSKGATIRTGGTHRGPYFQPTVLTGVTKEMRIYGEESFGPVTSIYCADDFDDAVYLANDTSFGLSAGIVTNDLQRAFEFAQRAESGMVHINDTTISDEPHITFGGVKNSGFGREGGEISMMEMSETKWITFQLGKRQFPF
jgi:aldehyde dehydrogenase (NAD+)